MRCRPSIGISRGETKTTTHDPVGELDSGVAGDSCRLCDARRLHEGLPVGADGELIEPDSRSAKGPSEATRAEIDRDRYRSETGDALTPIPRPMDWLRHLATMRPRSRRRRQDERDAIHVAVLHFEKRRELATLVLSVDRVPIVN